MLCINEIIIEHLSPPSDEERLKTILIELDGAFTPKLSERVDINEYAKKLAQSADIFYLKKNGIDIGNCAVYLNNKVYGFISSFAVKKKYTRMRMGESLWKAVHEFAMSKGIFDIILKVYEYNYNAIGFYSHIGFNVINKENKWITMQNKEEGKIFHREIKRL